MESKEKAIERARKLMSMAADSSSPNEAAIAARRARAIIDKYQIDMTDLKERSEFGERSAGGQRKRVPRWEQWLSIDIARLNDCIVDFDRRKQFIFKGFDEDAIVSRFMFTYITENCRRECKKYIEKNSYGCRGSFKTGYAIAVKEKIKEISETRRQELAEGTGKSLIVIKKDLVNRRFGEAEYRSTRPVNTADRRSFLEGSEAGKRVNIVTGVESEKREAIKA